jgi:adenosine deaminase
VFEKNKSDLHCHLNGSFSLAFLEETAKKHQCLELYQKFLQLRQEYLEQTENQPESGYSQELLNKAWKLFGFIHKIVRDAEDITLGTIDVVRNSAARYLEIRTTPKKFDEKSLDTLEAYDAYIDAFEAGLSAIKQDKEIKKEAYGLLSLDRTIHQVSDAQYFITRILESPNKVLVGLDICGNPEGTRTLSGEKLAKVVTLALESQISIAIHMGETDTDLEKQDTDAVLNALELWKSKQPPQEKNPFFGRVRLGHCIYLTQAQKEKIRSLGIPVEVCPTCHKKLNWYLENEKHLGAPVHPVASIYDDVNGNLVVGTDDDIIFGSPIKREFKEFMRFFKNATQMTKEQVKAHQAEFRFNCV